MRKETEMPDNKNRVLVTQLPSRREGDSWVPTIDITPASKHGEVEIILPMGINFPSAEMIKEQLYKKIIAFDRSRDILLPMGDPIVMAVACAMMGSYHGHFRMLKWDRHDHGYNVFEIEAD